MIDHLSDDFVPSSHVPATADAFSAPSISTHSLQTDAPSMDPVDKAGSKPISGSSTPQTSPTHLTAYSLIKALAAQGSTVEEARVAIDQATREGLELHGQNAKGLNGLHASAQTGRWDLAAELLQRGVDPLQKPKKGASFFTLAARSEQAPFEDLFADRPDLMQRREQRRAQIEAQSASVKKSAPVPFERLEQVQMANQMPDGASPSVGSVPATNQKTTESRSKRQAKKRGSERFGVALPESSSDSSLAATADTVHSVSTPPVAHVPRVFVSPSGLQNVSAQEALQAVQQCALNADEAGWNAWWNQGLPQEEDIAPGQTLIQALCATPDALLFALQHGLNANARNSQGQTALMTVVEQHYQTFAAARVLAGHGADFVAQDQVGNSALHRAAALGDDDGADWVEWLLAFGAQAHAKNKQGLTPAQVARQHDAIEIADMLDAHSQASPPPVQVQASAKPQWMSGGKAQPVRARVLGQRVEPGEGAPAGKKSQKAPAAKKAGKKSASSSKPGQPETASAGRVGRAAHVHPRGPKAASAEAGVQGAKKKKFGKKKADPIARAMDPNRTGFVSQSLSKPLREAREWYEPRVTPAAQSSFSPALPMASRLPAPEITVRKRRVLGPR